MSHLIRKLSRGRHIRRGERGQALVEFALILPVLLMIILGIADFGRALAFKNDQTHLASETARYAVVNSCPSFPCATSGTSLNAKMQAQAESTSATVTICYPNAPSGSPSVATQGDPLHVTVRDTFNWLPAKLKISTVGIDWNPGVSMSIVSNSEMRLEWDANAGVLPVYNISTWDSASKTCT